MKPVSVAPRPLLQKLVAQRRAAFEIGLIVIGLGALLIKPHGIFGTDALVRYQGLTELLEHGAIPNIKFSMVMPLFSAPLWFLGHVVSTPETLVSRFNILVFAAALLAMYALLRRRLDPGLIRTFFLILLVGSMFPDHLLAYYGEVFTAMLVAVGILAAVFRPSLGAWGLIVLGVINTPASIVALACVVLKRMLERRRWRYLLAIMAAAVLIGLEAWIRRGSPLNSGYENDKGFVTVMTYSGLAGFSYPFFLGLLSILFSFGKGLVFFAPGLLLPVKSRIMALAEQAKQQLYNTYVLWMAFLIGLILVYAQWWSWYGGWFWGPRFFLFASLPASLVLAVRLRHLDSSLVANLLTLLALALSFWVGIDGVIFGQQALDVCTANNYQLEFLCHYVPEFSVLWRPFVVAEPVSWRDWLYIAFSALVFVYLALPLLRVLKDQVIAQVTAFAGPYVKLSARRF